MNLYSEYLREIEERKDQGLHPKPIDGGPLLAEITKQIEGSGNEHREDSLRFFIYNTLPGTTAAAGVKAQFLKRIIEGEVVVQEITKAFAFELLSHMKGGPSIKVLLDLALGENEEIAINAGNIVKTQVFLYEADTERLKKAFYNGNNIAKDIIKSYAKAEFFTNLPEIEEEDESLSNIEL